MECISWICLRLLSTTVEVRRDVQQQSQVTTAAAQHVSQHVQRHHAPVEEEQHEVLDVAVTNSIA